MGKIWSGSASISGKPLEDLAGRQVALLPAPDDQLLGKCDQLSTPGLLGPETIASGQPW